jgi:hypothetical protein
LAGPFYGKPEAVHDEDDGYCDSEVDVEEQQAQCCEGSHFIFNNIIVVIITDLAYNKFENWW